MVVDQVGKGRGARTRRAIGTDGVERLGDRGGARRGADAHFDGKGLLVVHEAHGGGRVAKVRAQKANGTKEVGNLRQIKGLQSLDQVVVGNRGRRSRGTGDHHGSARRAKLGHVRDGESAAASRQQEVLHVLLHLVLVEEGKLLLARSNRLGVDPALAMPLVIGHAGGVATGLRLDGDSVRVVSTSHAAQLAILIERLSQPGCTDAALE